MSNKNYPNTKEFSANPSTDITKFTNRYKFSSNKSNLFKYRNKQTLCFLTIQMIFNIAVKSCRRNYKTNKR